MAIQTTWVTHVNVFQLLLVHIHIRILAAMAFLRLLFPFYLIGHLISLRQCSRLMTLLIVLLLMQKPIGQLFLTLIWYLCIQKIMFGQCVILCCIAGHSRFVLYS